MLYFSSDRHNLDPIFLCYQLLQNTTLKQPIKMEIASKTCSNKYWSRLCVIQRTQYLKTSHEISVVFKKVDHFIFIELFDPALP